MGMTPASPGVSKVLSRTKPRDLSLLSDPKVAASVVKASQLNIKKESLYLQSLYDNQLTPLNYASAVSVVGNMSSTFEVGLHVVSAALEKQHWCCVVDPNAKLGSLSMFETVSLNPRFVCVRNVSQNRFATVISYLVSSMRVVVAHVPTKVSSAQMARIMSRVRESNSILIFLDPAQLCEASFDKRIVAQTLSFKGIDKGAGVLIDREMKIEEYEHGIKISPNENSADLKIRYA